MLFHSSVKRCIVFLGPSSQWVQEENRVLVTFLEQLLSGVVQQENVTIVKGVSDLESIDDIGVLGFHLVVDFSGGESVLVKAVVELDLVDESGL